MESKKSLKTAIAPQKNLWKRIKRSWQVYVLILLPLIWFLMFEYYPLVWLRMSFYDFSLYRGWEGSEFVGFENFAKLFAKRNFLQMIWNALALNLWNLALGFPAPIIFALFLNEMRLSKVKSVVQTVSFIPHFISLVALIAIVNDVVNPTNGIITKILEFFGQESIYFMGSPDYFRPVMTLSGIWQGMGWGAIVYLAALTSIDPNLYEAAMVDGANRWHRIRHITLPGIAPTIITMLIMRIGGLLGAGAQKILLLQSSLNLETSEVLSTYLYKQGIQKMDYSMGTTVGIFNSLVSLTLVFIANKISKKVSETSLW